jgi:hypothetical protein
MVVPQADGWATAYLRVSTVNPWLFSPQEVMKGRTGGTKKRSTPGVLGCVGTRGGLQLCSQRR